MLKLDLFGGLRNWLRAGYWPTIRTWFLGPFVRHPFLCRFKCTQPAPRSVNLFSTRDHGIKVATMEWISNKLPDLNVKVPPSKKLDKIRFDLFNMDLLQESLVLSRCVLLGLNIMRTNIFYCVGVWLLHESYWISQTSKADKSPRLRSGLAWGRFSAFSALCDKHRLLCPKGGLLIRSIIR